MRIIESINNNKAFIMHINPNLFFLFKDGDFVVWDYQNHQQFALEDAYFERLKLWSQGKVTQPSPIDEELLGANLLSTIPISQGEWGWDLLSHIFHKGTSDISENILTAEQWTESYLDYCAMIAKNPLPIVLSNANIELPTADVSLLKTTDLIDVFYKRKTCRSFHSELITLSQLSTLLYFSFGNIHKEWPDLDGLQQLGIRKAFPSGGGLHPEEVYIVVLRVEGLEAGVYHYDCINHRLRLVKTGFFEQKVVELVCSQYFAEGIAVGLFLTSKFEKSWWKYPHSRGYRVCLLDMGHASQTCLLTASGLGLHTWVSGAFSDSNIRTFLELESETEFPLFFIGIGHGDNDSLNPKIRKALE